MQNATCLPGNYAFYPRQRDEIEATDAASEGFEASLMQPAYLLLEEAFNSVHMHCVVGELTAERNGIGLS